VTPVDGSLAAALGVGFLLGLRHALDPDHVAAVSAFASAHRSVLRTCLVGTCWGVGHTVALLAAAVVTLGFRLTISASVERVLEQLVALALVLLGGHVLLRSAGALRLHRHAHEHDGQAHSHVHVHVGGDVAHDHGHLLRAGRGPFLMGIVHGLAGSAALTLLVLASMPSPVHGLFYVAVFGAGSTLGMLVLSGLIGIPFVVAAGRSASVAVILQMLAGAFSLALGIWLAWNLRISS
jgi:ABC-type nickel/cobalt efflux system permease component RcnA